ncbi:uncharacterized protein KY384_002439 [Bacidia gigantensis]|uniref:uncharacterized protein n=1 Tax=Bacidia gigantensis TaxID=2732470 RepID=UPI001D049284|nr:uncharacterized protein KY384_002439 [Bacidia gigantensis]KAG8532562.1 hypothetical protein KY384_002439 [Bacidia gigantensis]
MPDIDPASLNSAEPLQTSLNPSSLTLSKPNAITTSAVAPKAAKASNDKGSQRVDLEPIYTNLKTAVGERWADYKEAIKEFVLGKLNQSELSLRIDYYICASPETEHLHNSLITALYANAYREPPEPGVAPWVAANDKPSVVGGGAAGKGNDKVEERLRREVMALPGRDRKRLKAVGERDTHDPNTSATAIAMHEYRVARSIKLQDSVPASAGGLNKTNWDLEIRKRYTHPLFHETLEFPDSPSIQNRMLPICYEEALPNGPADQCAEFMVTATEMFIKDVVGSVISLTRNNFLSSNAKNGYTNGHVGKPPPLHSSASMGVPGQRPLSKADLRVSLGIASCSLGPMPDIITDVMGSWPEGVLEGWDTYDAELDLSVPGLGRPTSSANSTTVPKVPDTDSIMVNGTHDVLMNGVATHETNLTNGNVTNGIVWEEPAVDGWAGSSTQDRDRLFDTLDECLAFGQ